MLVCRSLILAAQRRPVQRCWASIFWICFLYFFTHGRFVVAVAIRVTRTGETLFLLAHFKANDLRLKVQNFAESKESRCVVVPVHQAMNRLPCMPNDLAWNLDDRGLEGSEFHCQ